MHDTADAPGGRDFVPPTQVRFLIDGAPAFTRRFGKRVRALPRGSYTDVRGDVGSREVTLPVSAFKLAKAILDAYPQSVRLKEGGYGPRPRIDLFFKWHDRAVRGFSDVVQVLRTDPDPVGTGIGEIEERWNDARVSRRLEVGESEPERRARHDAQTARQTAHRQVLAIEVAQAGGQLVQLQHEVWFGRGLDVALMESYEVRFRVGHEGVSCTGVVPRGDRSSPALKDEPVPPAALADLLIRLGGHR
jgi:hypothetical protein